MESKNLKLIAIFLIISFLITGCAVNNQTNSKGISEGGTADAEADNGMTKQEKDSLKFELLSEISKSEIRDDTSTDIYKLIENAELGDVMDIRTIIEQYCYEKYKSVELEESECQDMIKKLKEKGDVLKDEAFEKIKKDEKNLARNLYEMQALLMAQREAGGEDTVFSTSNVEKVNKETKELMKKRFEKILEEGSLEELHQEMIWIMANTPATCGTSHETEISPTGFGLYGSEICGFKQKIIQKARQKVANMLAKKDLCNLDDGEKQEIINSIPHCSDLINDEDFCTKLKNGDVVGAYNQLLDRCTTNHEKIDCDKETTETDAEDEETDDTNQTETNTTTEDGTGGQTGTGTTTEIRYYNDEIIGWDFEIMEGEITRDDVYSCIMNCGFEPPLEIISEPEMLCYDRMINSEVPCEPKPMIPEDVQICTEGCLEEILI